MGMKAITANVTGGSALERHLKEIEKRLGRGSHLRVGFLASATYPAEQERMDKEKVTIKGKNARDRRARNLHSGLHVAQVAFWNEFGTKGIPSRPFFRTMIERKSPRWGVGLGIALRKTKYDAEMALNIMGGVIAGELRQSINNWTDPPNSQRTIDEKGFNKPLIDTAVMIRSIDHQVMTGLSASDEND